MSYPLFVFVLIVSTLLRIPLSLILIVFKDLSPFLKDRILFERKNLIDSGTASFKDRKADALFFMASEGEFEQVRPLIDLFILKKKKIELVFTSPSVEKKIKDFYQLHEEQVRYLRLPLVSFFPINFLYFQSLWQFVSAKHLFLCRYDFYPEILLLKILFRKKLYLLSGAIKKPDWYKLQSLKTFDYILAVTNKEKIEISKITKVEIDVFDLRIPRIIDRSHHFESKLSQHENLKWILNHYQKLPNQSKLILGNIWPSDLDILNSLEWMALIKDLDLNILIVPHKIDAKFLAQCEKKLMDLNLPSRISKVSQIQDFQIEKIQLLDFSGYLCECYNLFPISYVGGGFDRSIHSVLEPVFSQCKLITGPKIFRSTEWDLSFEMVPNEIRVLKNPESFYNEFIALQEVDCDLSIRRKFANGSTKILEKLQSLLNED